ncbi:hypothetical protein Avbf_06364 [Armadillidium vulgare]|nr:hypothetical protein Avbf_06364 [Armadillidium vulgare]
MHSNITTLPYIYHTIIIKYLAKHCLINYFFFQLCLAECNAKKSLELHCSGMKHLKKKDMWEKEGKPQPPISLSGENGQPKVPPGESSRDRRRTRTRSPPPLMRKRIIGSAERARYDRSREPPRGYGNDYDRDMHAPPYDYDRFYQRGRYYDEHDDRDRYGPPAPGGYGSVDPTDSRGPPGLPRYSPKRERGYSPVTRRDYDYEEKRRPSPIRPRYYGDKRSRSPEKKRSPYGSKREKGRSPYSPRNKRSPRRDSPYKVATPPSPPKISSSRKEEPEKKVNLANSPAGSLLQKLAECCVKSSEDADLALNVVAALTKSLKEYCQRNEETKLAELLMEAELKVGTVKALKAGMKMLSNFTADAGTANISPGNVFPTFLGINHPPPTHSQPPMPPPTHAPSMYGTSSQSGHFNY